MKIAIPIIVFLMVFFATQLLEKFIASDDAAIETPHGISSVVACPKCGNVEVKPIVDIKKSHCSKCRAQEWFAAKCAKCGKIFPLDESKYDDAKDELLDELPKEDRCPFCGSTHIIGVKPNEISANNVKK
jgi:predicted RNA-binding Zn-ribbon protein involved in translation (DUF1610 family)